MSVLALVSTIDTRTTRTDAAARLTVDLGAVAANTRLLADRAAASGAETMAVVKADGFGHGAVDVARTALGHGATWLGVTSVAEALPLREAGLDAPILSWLNPVGPSHGATYDDALRADVDLAVPSSQHLATVAAAARRTGRSAAVHLHLDTGMARDGAMPEEWAGLCRAARRAERAGLVHVVGVMGHLPCAETPDHEADRAGRARFAWGLQTARATGLRPRHRHLAATAATLDDPRSHHTMVRVGAGLVGIGARDAGLRWAVTLTAPLVQVRRVRGGTGVGYGHTWTAPGTTHLGLLPLGYADGLPRVASGRAEVLVGGVRRPLVGRISMDTAVVDLGPDTTAGAGDTVVVVGPGDRGEPTPADWARWSDTLPHEVLTGLRVSR